MTKCRPIDPARALASAAAGALMVLVFAGAPSARARDAVEGYPWCARTEAFGGALDCAYVNLPQCLATVSGVGGDCVVNPYLPYFADERPARRYRKRHTR